MINSRHIAASASAVTVIAAALLATFEGEIRQTYLDPIGVPTACIGHTGPEVKLGQRYTAERCQVLLQQDLLEANADVDRCIKAPLTVGQRAAMVSFVFNVGGKKFCGSGVARRLNAADYAGACAELSRWVYAGGRVLPGLVKRRAAERAMCERKT
ncbi:MAG: lysozyme [Proteobacteria bacterium]|nr:lysozyme [Pseudomonadota bacterium]